MPRTIVGVLIVALAGCTPAGEVPTAGSACLDGLAAHRASLDDAFATGEHPLSEAQKAGFDGLEYYPPNDAFCVPATFSKAGQSETFEMPSYNEKSIPFREYGVFEFELDGSVHSLTAYQRMDLPDEERQWVLVPFRDGTNGQGTYGGGRYLEIRFPIRPQTEIDFNRAANPWCAYDARYTCPVPPVENWLNLPIEAGEKMFRSAHAEPH